MPALRTGDGEIRIANRADSGCSSNSLQQLLVVASHVQIVVTPRARIQSDLEHVGFVKAEVDGTEELEAADEEPSAEEQYERKRDLSDDERFAELGRAAAETRCVLL